MRDNKIYCDHCGKELDTMHDFDDTQIDMAHKWTTADLCAECLDKLYDLVCDFCERKGGEWIDTGDEILDTTYSGWKCSKCGYIFCGSQTNYCPNCGAKRRGDTE